jgi:hypothetical protein
MSNSYRTELAMVRVSTVLSCFTLYLTFSSLSQWSHFLRQAVTSYICSAALVPVPHYSSVVSVCAAGIFLFNKPRYKTKFCVNLHEHGAFKIRTSDRGNSPLEFERSTEWWCVPDTPEFRELLYNFIQFVGHASQGVLTATNFGQCHTSPRRLMNWFQGLCFLPKSVLYPKKIP